jgi:hypothetical protein
MAPPERPHTDESGETKAHAQPEYVDVTAEVGARIAQFTFPAHGHNTSSQQDVRTNPDLALHLSHEHQHKHLHHSGELKLEGQTRWSTPRTPLSATLMDPRCQTKSTRISGCITDLTKGIALLKTMPRKESSKRCLSMKANRRRSIGSLDSVRNIASSFTYSSGFSSLGTTSPRRLDCTVTDKPKSWWIAGLILHR